MENKNQSKGILNSVCDSVESVCDKTETTLRVGREKLSHNLSYNAIRVKNFFRLF